MKALLDTGFLYAVFDKDDEHHSATVATLSGLEGDLLLPTPVLVELAYLLQARLGHQRMQSILRQLMQQSLYLVPITPADLIRVNALLVQYADAELDFVDAVLVALAERLNIQRILTVDRRDFALIRPKHRPYFEILP